ncbi:response regulator [Paenibacillus validus]|uniref:Response regulator n=1 Tax=Paenibacillus validus TaxID=44253 RepID=A0A7X2ZBH7_9BACL|nr:MULTISPECIES: response regulator [Paenibacillus]MED4603204.1 response regulator [Paenibacillus validus]MED4606133.1 response regulator [Paenibacillus validus]MUG71894.1 response regulator [Paenibacillus validus]
MANIMIVDDAAFMRMMLKQMITEFGHQVVAEAQNGIEAIAAYEKFRPDLVTMDITMPDMDGIEAVKNIKSIDAGAKIIMCSAMGQQGMVLQAIQAGARDFIVKPFQKDRVGEAISKILG